MTTWEDRDKQTGGGQQPRHVGCMIDYLNALLLAEGHAACQATAWHAPQPDLPERCKLARRIYLFPGFLEREKAGHIVELAQRRLRPSGLAFKKGDTEANNR